jgi:hypothetical protein
MLKKAYNLIDLTQRRVCLREDGVGIKTKGGGGGAKKSDMSPN